MIRKLFPIELILLLSFIVSVFTFFGYLLYRYCKSIRARTTLLLKIGSDKEKFTKTIGTLPLSASFYEIQVNRQATEIRLTEGFFNVQLHLTGLDIKDNILNKPADIPSAIKLFPWQLAKLRRITSQPFYALVHILAVNNELVDIVVLRKHHPANVGIAGDTIATVVQVPRLYPEKTLKEMG